jgi:hypothetical protein
MTARDEGPIVIPVLDGQRCLVHVLGRGRHGYEAFHTNDVSLGVFLTKGEAAADALLIISRSSGALRWVG